MTKIGAFIRVKDEFHGEIITLSVQARDVRIVPHEDGASGGPTHRVLVGRAEIGHGWSQPTSDGRTLRIVLDDPSFAAPILATLAAATDSDAHFTLTWSRTPGP